MTAGLERPDPYNLKPKSRTGRSTTRVRRDAPPTDAQVALQEAVRAMLHERLGDARDLLVPLTSEDALESRDPLAIDALAYLSSVHFCLGDVKSAIATSTRALDLGPSRFAPNQKAGEMALRLGDSELAAARFLAALRASEPGTSDARAAEGSLREARRRAARGIRHEARAPRLAGWANRLIPGRRRPTPAPGSVTAGIQQPE
jgi:predicted Zn-dependent protease